MALSTEQAALVQTAVDNLNKSVQTNEAILELLRSFGATGVVDIGIHTADLNAHPNLNGLLINGDFKVGTKAAFDAAKGTMRLQALSKASDSAATGGLFDMWGIAANASTSQPYMAWRFNAKLADSCEWGKVSTPLGQISLRVSDSTHTSVSPTRVEFLYSDANKFCCGITVTSDLDNAASSYNRYYFTEGNFFPLYSKGSLGNVTAPWDNAYLKNAPVVSSDERVKANIADIPTKVMKAWGKVDFKQYQLKDAIEKKGEANARKHIGAIAQDIIKAFQNEGLDPFEYGIVCHETWQDIYDDRTVVDVAEVVDESGNVVAPEKTHKEKILVKSAGDQYSVRYEEALALECAYQRWRLAQIEARLS